MWEWSWSAWLWWWAKGHRVSSSSPWRHLCSVPYLPGFLPFPPPPPQICRQEELRQLSPLQAESAGCVQVAVKLVWAALLTFSALLLLLVQQQCGNPWLASEGESIRLFTTTSGLGRRFLCAYKWHQKAVDSNWSLGRSSLETSDESVPEYVRT